jgi:hypothetical protein
MVAAHEAFAASTTAPVALCPQGGMHSWAAIAAMVEALKAPDLAHEDAVLSRSRTRKAAPPGVVAARRHLEHAADEAHRIGGSILLDEGKPYFDTSAKVSTAFLTCRAPCASDRADEEAWHSPKPDLPERALSAPWPWLTQLAAAYEGGADCRSGPPASGAALWAEYPALPQHGSAAIHHPAAGPKPHA